MSKKRVIACPQCQQDSSLLFVTRDFNREISSEEFTYFRCQSCGLIFLDPIPVDLSRYYPGDYYIFPGSQSELARSSKPEQYKLDLLTSQLRRGRLIEIGPATGGFCFLAKQAGFEVHAIEMDERCSVFLRDVVGVHVQNSNEEVAALEREDTADAIALWHVIEHLRDPWTMLDAIARKLRKGGVAVIATPNPGAFQFRIWGKRWTHVDAPRHVVLIPIELMVERMRANGMDLVKLTTADAGGIGWNWFGWVFSSANLTGVKWFKRPLRLLGRIPRALVKGYEDREGKGAAYTAIFRKVVA